MLDHASLGKLAPVEFCPTLLNTPKSAICRQLSKRLSLSAAHIDNAHVATAATSWASSAREAGRESLSLVWKVNVQRSVTIRATSRTEVSELEIGGSIPQFLIWEG